MPVPADQPETVVPVALGVRSYSIRVGSGPGGFGRFTRSALESAWAGRSARNALVVTDCNVAKLPCLEACQAELEDVGIACTTAVLPPGEATKSLNSAALLYDRLIEQSADRHTVVLALGGGVIGDLAGFAAATYARGLPLVMVPTTLLAQVDSSVGGKVGVNHPRAKNIIGAFHQPRAVWIDTETLQSLSPRELRCGLAEVVKYGVIMDADFFADLEGRAAAILERDPAALRDIVARSCRLKARVVVEDEREETGARAVLNFGHTIAHAIEAVAGYEGDITHGEAVAAGMVAESHLAARLGWVDDAFVGRLVSLLERFGLPTRFAGLDLDRLERAMSYDKKNQQGKIRFVLPRALGRVELTAVPGLDDVRAVLRFFFG
jgi:3-dehydroquinate synthase